MSAVALLLIAPLAAGFASLGARRPRILHGINLTVMLILIGAEAVLIRRVLREGNFTLFNGLMAVDALSGFILFVITVIGFSSALYTRTYFEHYRKEGIVTPARMSRYFFLFHLFVFAMNLAVLANSLGILWVAIEGTTLATTFLINFFKRKTSLEAGWKYLILCSVGIALALFGTVLMYMSSVRALGEGHATLNITELMRVAAQLDPHAVKLAFVFILVGYGTKVGLVPMHTWVPEAYSEAPAPVVAMLAGVLETVAVYAVLRCKMVVDATVSPGYAGNFLLALGFLSFVTAALFMLVQRDYKRLFAYSSIEHMGIAMVGFGAGGFLGTFGGLFHLLNHALAKSLAFFAAGRLFIRFETREIASVRGVFKVQPLTAAALLAASLALVGMPPLSMFVSEFSVAAALATQAYGADTIHIGHFLTITVADEVRDLGLVFFFMIVAVVVFGGLMFRVMKMVWGDPPSGIGTGETWGWGHLSLVLNIGALLILGFLMPEPLKRLMSLAVATISTE
ncbi:MAG TPA: proton-conducting transporter membrane subunit [Nitrospiria bacterium]|nr:proton-conducting transporter membrane subunit [Nitrospiria bacterium]